MLPSISSSCHSWRKISFINWSEVPKLLYTTGNKEIFLVFILNPAGLESWDHVLWKIIGAYTINLTQETPWIPFVSLDIWYQIFRTASVWKFWTTKVFSVKIAIFSFKVNSYKAVSRKVLYINFIVLLCKPDGFPELSCLHGNQAQFSPLRLAGFCVQLTKPF